jgi:myosin protein heavy chain
MSTYLFVPPDTKHQLQKRIQDENIVASTSSAAQSGMLTLYSPLPYLTTEVELRTVIETYKAKEQSYQERLEAAEIARAKAARGEAYGEDS